MPIPLLGGLLAGGGIAQGLGSLFGAGVGLHQLIRAGRMNPRRPTREITNEVKDRLALDQQLLNAGMPGERQARQDIYQSGATAMDNVRQGATSSGSLLAAAGGLQGATNRGLNTLAQQVARDFQRRQSNLNRSQDIMNREKQENFRVNEMQPYLEERAEKNALTRAGLQNISGFFGDAGGMLGGLYSAESETGALSDLFGQMGGGSGAPSYAQPNSSIFSGVEGMYNQRRLGQLRSDMGNLFSLLRNNQ